MSILNKFTPVSKAVMKHGAMVVAVGCVAASFLAPEMALAGAATENASQVAARVESQVLGFKALAVTIAFMLGVILFIAGLWMLYKDSKQPGQGHAKNGLIAMLVGTGLLVVQTLVGVTAQSVTNNGATAQSAVSAVDSGF